jgi:hypothetical protein
MSLFGFDGAAGNFDPAADIAWTLGLLMCGGLLAAAAVVRLLAWVASPRAGPASRVGAGVDAEPGAAADGGGMTAFLDS